MIPYTIKTNIEKSPISGTWYIVTILILPRDILKYKILGTFDEQVRSITKMYYQKFLWEFKENVEIRVRATNNPDKESLYIRGYCKPPEYSHALFQV